MPELKHQVKLGLDEVRTLMLGVNVFLGFQFRTFFEKGFERIPQTDRYVKLVALLLICGVGALLMAPAAYHRLAEHGDMTPRLLRFFRRCMATALVPFAAAMGMDLTIAVDRVDGRGAAIASGVAATLIALFFWYGMGLAHAARHSRRSAEERSGETMDGQAAEEDRPDGALKDRIEHALTEVRVVLPGAQALLGFQFAVMFSESFEKLPTALKQVHLVSLGLLALSIVLLMTPAAYHRLGERGEYSEHFHRLAGRFLISAMIPLALGIAGDVHVVVQHVTGSAGAGYAAAGGLLFLCFGLWFGLSFAARILNHKGHAGCAGARVNG